MRIFEIIGSSNILSILCAAIKKDLETKSAREKPSSSTRTTVPYPHAINILHTHVTIPTVLVFGSFQVGLSFETVVATSGKPAACCPRLGFLRTKLDTIRPQ